MKLKTLKDIKSKITCTNATGKLSKEYMCEVYEKEIKAEAVKCAKYFDKKMEESEAGEEQEMGFIYWKGRFDEVMERNNLTEEDLK